MYKRQVVYGETYVNIGSSAAETDTLKRDNIEIDGTVFGGGEANASGSEDYDFTFISVTQGITIQIDGTDYTDRNFYLNGSIFGSGNASVSYTHLDVYKRQFIQEVGAVTGREVSKEKEDKLVNTIMNDKVPTDLDSMM